MREKKRRKGRAKGRNARLGYEKGGAKRGVGDVFDCCVFSLSTANDTPFACWIFEFDVVYDLSEILRHGLFGKV